MKRKAADAINHPAQVSGVGFAGLVDLASVQPLGQGQRFGRAHDFGAGSAPG